MIWQSAPGVYRSTLISQFKTMNHGFSGRSFGDMRNFQNRQIFFKALGMEPKDALFVHQIHTDKIHEVVEFGKGTKRADFDGLMYTPSIRMRKSPILCIFSADCAPVICVDPQKSIIGIAHSGWRGTLLDISSKLIQSMAGRGSQLKNIHVAIGPSIGSCCYNITVERAKLFRSMYGQKNTVVTYCTSTYFLDIAEAIKTSIALLGVPVRQIDIAEICTSTSVNDFYSYRKDAKSATGMNISFVTLSN